MFNIPNFEQMLEDNLRHYCVAPSDIAQKDLFQTHREISIARFALTAQAQAYAKSIELLTEILDTQSKLNQNDPAKQATVITNIMSLINMIETKSQNLIDSVQRVANLLKTVVDIDIDKQALRTMLVNLPALVKSSISQVTNDPDLADKITLRLNIQIDQMFQTLRFDQTLIETQHSANDQQIFIDQYQQMVNSVPLSPPYVSQ